MDLVNTLGVRQHPLVLVRQERPLLPGTLPELVDGLEVFLSPVVPLVMTGELGGAEVAMRVLEHARDDVPPGAAIGQVIQRGELTGELERMGLDDG
jgi:hypothetical protein